MNQTRDTFMDLQPGDRVKALFSGVTTPVQLTSGFMSVLAVDEDGVSFSIPSGSPSGASHRPYVGYNPFRWDEGKQAVVQSSGHRVSFQIVSVEQGIDMVVAEDYARVPRLKDLTRSLPQAILETFAAKDPRYAIIVGLAQNNESGSDLEQMALLFQLMGVPCTDELLAAIVCLCQLNSTKRFRALGGY